MTVTSVRRRDARPGFGVALLAVVTLVAACSTDGADETDPGGAATPATPTTTQVTEPTPSITAAPVTTTSTTVPLPPLSERFSMIEVSALVSTGVGQRVVTITATGESLARASDPGGPDGADAWCSGVAGTDPGPFVLRVSGDAVATAEGDITAFEVVSDGTVEVDPGAAADPDPDGSPVVPTEIFAVLRIDDDGGGDLDGLEALSVVVLDDEPATGSFRAETADGIVVEGAFRCS